MTRKPWNSGDDDPTLRIEEGNPNSMDDMARTLRRPPAPQAAPAPRPMLPRFETTGSFTHLRDRPPPVSDEPVTVQNVEAVRNLPPPPRPPPGRFPSVPPVPPRSRPAPSAPAVPRRVPLSQAVERQDPTIPILLKPRPAPPKIDLSRDDRTVDAPLSDPRTSQSIQMQVLPSQPLASRPSVPIATPTPPPTASSRPPLVLPSSDPSPSMKERLLDVLPTRVRAPFEGQASRAAAFGVAAALAISILFSVVLFLALRDSPEDGGEPKPVATLGAPPAFPTAQPASTAAGTKAPSMIMTCGLARSGQLLTRALPGVLPMVSTAPGTARAAVGFASGRNRAEGIVVHLDDLSVERRFDEERNGSVFRVTPLTDRAPVTFAVDSDDSRARGIRTIPAQPPIRLGSNNFGLVRLDPGREPSVVWPGGNNEDNGEPAFATLERSALVTFRRGRTSGEVLAGWLSASGTADSELGRVDAGAREVAAPAVATGDSLALIVFPARAQNERWHLRVAKTPRGKLPAGSQVLEGAASGTSDATSPAIAALPNGGWVVQWIESTQSAKRLITQAYDERLVPRGLPVEIASGSLQELPGGLVYKDGRVLSVYLTMNGGTSELWGVVLRCG